ncbi:tetratricopeptide repeat protein [Actinoplanes sp. NPDC000266]
MDLGVPSDPVAPTAGTVISASSGVQVGDHNTQTNLVVDASTLPAPQTPGADGPAVHNLPPATAVFEGRDVAVLDRLLGRGPGTGLVVGQAAVHGLGGIGKSELVNQFARAFLDQYRLVWWVTAENRQALELGLAALTARLHPVAMLADAQAWAVGWLQSHSGWLLILDNVEDIADIEPLLGQVAGHGRLVVTTRRDLGLARWTRFGLTPMRLGVLEPAASVRLLVRLTGSDDVDGAGRLARALGDLPLALEQAAAYISQHDGFGFDGYLRLLTERFGLVAADPGECGPAQRTVAAVWRASMGAVAARSAPAVRALQVLAWLGPDNLPEDVLDPLGADDPVVMGDALAVLASFSLVTRGGGQVSVHRLVQAVVRRQTPAGDGAEPADATAVSLLRQTIPRDPIGNVAGWPRWNQLLPHIDALTEHAGPRHNHADLMYVNDRAAAYRQFQGQTSAAILQFEQVLVDRRRVLGDDHPDTLTSRHNLAGGYESAGRVAEAITLYEQVLIDQRRVLGNDHPGTLASRSNLAGDYRSVGRIAEAIILYEQVLTDRRRMLGDDHPDTLTSRGLLAGAYASVGRVAEAITLFERVLIDQRRVLGDDHPATLGSCNNLAGAYASVGRIAEAISLHEQVLAERRRVLGDDHPGTLASRHNLAGAYVSVGRVTEAITLYEQVLNDFRRMLGDDHPDTLSSRHNLGYAYESAGRVADAITLYEQALTGQRRALGDDHPDTLTSRSNLAGAFVSAGRTAEAIILYEQVLTDRRRVLGDDHPDTLSSRHNVGYAYESAGRIAEAITLYEQVLADYRRVLGGDHPDTLTSCNNLAGAYASAGRIAEAITLYEQVLAKRSRVLGRDHPRTTNTASMLRGVLEMREDDNRDS